MNLSKFPPDDPKLTAYALGELEGDERAAVEVALRDDPAAQAAVEEIRATAALLSAALAGEAAADSVTGTRPPLHKAAIIPGSDYRRLDGGPLGKLIRFPQLYYVVGGLAAACVAVMVALRQPEPKPVPKVYTEVALAQAPMQAKQSETLPEPVAVAEAKDAAQLAQAQPLSAPAPMAFQAGRELTKTRLFKITSGIKVGGGWDGVVLPPDHAINVDQLFAPKTNTGVSQDKLLGSMSGVPLRLSQRGSMPAMVKYTYGSDQVPSEPTLGPLAMLRLPSSESLQKSSDRFMAQSDDRWVETRGGWNNITLLPEYPINLDGIFVPKTLGGVNQDKLLGSMLGVPMRLPQKARLPATIKYTISGDGPISGPQAFRQPPFSDLLLIHATNQSDDRWVETGRGWDTMVLSTERPVNLDNAFESKTIGGANQGERFGLVLAEGPNLRLQGTQMLVDNSASKFVFSFPLQDYLKADSATTTRIGMEILRVPRPPSAAATNTEAYAYVRDNDFLGTAENPLSTFSVAVDTASYANVRRFIQSGRLPPADAVRVEELVNYFPYHYASPAGDAPLAVSMEVADAPWAPAHRLVRIGLKGRELAIAARPPANLVFLIDVSGSMNEPAKLPLVKEAMRLLVGRLRPDDRVAIVVYAGASGLALPSTPVAKRREILAALDALTAGGPTNGAMGLQLAYDIAKANFVPGGVNRVILCTDGDFNVGVTSEGELTRLIQEKAKSGVSLTALGFGMGNYKDAMLKQLADQGNGNYGYIDTRREAEKLLVEQVNGTLMTVAKDVKLQVEFNPAQVASYRLIGYEDRLLKKEDFNDEAAEGGEIGAGHTVTALYEIVPTENPKSETRNPKSAALLTLKVRYREPAATVSLKREFPLTDAGARFADASADFKFAAAVAEFGMILRDSPHKGAGTLDQVVAWAEAGTDSDAGGDRGEFVGLVRQADVLMR